jgi:hypothetical protein
VAAVAAAMSTDLAPPDSHKGARITVGATPRQDVAISSLDDGEFVTGALVGHGCSSAWRDEEWGYM